MMRQVMVAAAAALTLAACNQQSAGGPALPPLQEGAQAPAQLTAAPPARQAQITDEVRQQLIDNIGQQLNDIGGSVAPSAAPLQGFTDVVVPMQPSTDHRLVMDLAGGAQYSFIGACDGDCTNVDLELIDMRTGGVVASDMLADDYPVVHFRPEANGQYMVRLLMQSCSVAPCYAGARALVHGAAASAPK